MSRKNDDALTSLLQMSKDFDSQIKARKIYGLKQNVMAKPLCIMYWMEVGNRIYHELSKQDRLFWDATSSVVQKCNGADVLETRFGDLLEISQFERYPERTTVKDQADIKYIYNKSMKRSRKVWYESKISLFIFPVQFSYS